MDIQNLSLLVQKNISWVREVNEWNFLTWRENYFIFARLWKNSICHINTSEIPNLVYFCYERHDSFCNHSSGDLFFMYKDNMLTSRVRISCFMWNLTWYFTGVYINYINTLFNSIYKYLTYSSAVWWAMYLWFVRLKASLFSWWLRVISWFNMPRWTKYPENN